MVDVVAALGPIIPILVYILLGYIFYQSVISRFL